MGRNIIIFVQSSFHSMKPMNTNRIEALKESGMDIKHISKKTKYTEAYLRRMFRGGPVPYHIAERLSRLLGCRMEIFL